MTRYLPYWACYLHQGMVTALMLQGVAGYFRHAGLDLAQLSWLPLTMLPWVAKFLWAPWGERHALPLRGNRYLGSLALLQLGMAALMAGIGLLSPTHSVGIVVLSLMLLAFFSASHDIYADGITICTTDERSRPFANAAQVGGSYLGIVFGSFVFLSIVHYSGWRDGFFGMAALSLALLLLPLLLARPTRAAPGSEHARLDLRSLRDLWPALALTAIYYLSIRGLMALQTVMLVDRGLSLTGLGEAIVIYSTVASGIGILLGGLLARRVGGVRSLLPIMLLHVAVAAVFALGYPQFDLSAWLVLFGFLNMAAAIGFVTLYNVLMGLVRPHQPAADYALFQSADAAVAVLVSFAALRVAHHTGYRPVLAGLAVISIANLLPARSLCRRLTGKARPTSSATPAAQASEVIHG
jgi:MFS transporter (putative signal transducer)